MGESVVDASNDEDKMGETVPSDPVLEVSVSFGRFENDSLSWEKWSSFSPNKYLEEVEKCATPGSVAKKKAYFEAHYKKIAARKAELLDQEKQMESKPLRSNDQNCGVDLSENTCEADPEFSTSNGQCSSEGDKHVNDLASEVSDAHVDEPNEDAADTVEWQRSSVAVHYKKIAARKVELLDQEKQVESKPLRSNDQNGGVELTENTCEADPEFSISNGQCSSEGDKHVNDLASEVSDAHVDEPNEDAAVTVECHSSSVEEVKEEVGGSLGIPKLDKPEETLLVKEEEKEKSPSKERDSTPKSKEGSVKVDHPREPRKINQVNKKTTMHKNAPLSKESNLARIKKKTASPVVKSSEFSTPRVSKPTSTFTAMSMSRSSTKKENVSTLPRSMNPSSGGSKKMAPKSLHMSLSLGPSGSDPASLTTTRKSFIMEKMGDKDIVKRAFKTFQNNHNQLKYSVDERSAAPKQVPAKGADSRVSALTPRKENSGSLKAGGLEKKSAKTAPSSFRLKSDERAEKRKEVSKNLEKSNAREEERTRLQTKSKDRETEIKKLSQSLNFKATPLPGFYRGQKMSKGPSGQEGSSKETRR